MVFRFLKKRKEEKKERKIIGTCIICNQPVYEDEEHKTISFQGNRYIVHLRCFRKAKKAAKKLLRSGFNVKNLLNKLE